MSLTLSGQSSWTGFALSLGCPTGGAEVCLGSLTSSGTNALSFDSLNYSEDYQSAMIIAHNPGLTNLINSITNILLDNLPTTGIAEIIFDCAEWNNISLQNSNLIELKFPKQLK